MRVLFLSITAGHGHHQTAKACVEYLCNMGVESTMLNAFEYINPVLSETVARGYLISTQFSPSVYGQLYRMAEKKEKKEAKYSIIKLTSSLLNMKLINYVKEYNPDVIVATHIFSAQLASHLRESGKTKAITIGIVTDFTIHPFWEDTSLDYYITASELLNNQAEKRGFDMSKIKPLGIPVHMKFSERIPQYIAREMLGIEDKRTVFLMSGSMGYGNVAKVLKQIDRLNMDFQIISVCGYNNRSKKKIDKLKTNRKVYNYGFVDNVDVIMDASDCIITKPGGLTVCESLAKGLPPVLINPIPGQEDRNVDFLLNNGIAQLVTPTYPVDDALYQMFNNTFRHEHIRESIKNISKPTAARDVGNFIIDLIKNKK